MARKIDTEKKKKKRYGLRTFILLLIALLVLCGFGIFGKGPFKGMKNWFGGNHNKPVEIKVLDELKDYLNNYLDKYLKSRLQTWIEQFKSFLNEKLSSLLVFSFSFPCLFSGSTKFNIKF